MLTESQKRYLESLYCPFTIYTQKACSQAMPIQEVLPPLVYPDTPGYEFSTEGSLDDLKAFLETSEGIDWFYQYRPDGIILVHTKDQDVHVK